MTSTRDQEGVTGMRTAPAGSAGAKRRDVFDGHEASALAELERAWADGGYHGFSADGGTCCAVSSAGEVLTGGTPDALDKAIRAHWQAMQ
jgi:hypothetical protein